ncbi:MAG: hypothetical protein H0U55_12730 [Rubrobacteraceae bacterium]|nr:hypothetical protein [Rubrobacteraceae bacterium]
MRRKQSSVVFLLLPLIFTVLLVGCGGGSDQSGGGGQENKQDGKAADKVTKKEQVQKKSAFGIVRAFKDDKRRLSLSPTVNAQGNKPIGFKVRKKAQITLGGKKADLGDIKEDQQAQISYVVKNEVNRAVVVRLFEPSEKPAGGDEKKENPPEGGEKSG